MKEKSFVTMTPGTNALAYLAIASATKRKSFINLKSCLTKTLWDASPETCIEAE
jgi:hypothetical protein